MRAPVSDHTPLPADGPDHWLALRFGHLGDVVLVTGALRYLAVTYGWTFSVMTSAPFAGIFQGNPHVREIIAVERSDLSPASFVPLARDLARRRQGQGLLDLHGSLRSRLLAGFWQGPVRRYRKMSARRRIFLASRGRLCGDILRASTVAQRYVMAVETSPPDPSLLLPEIALAETERADAPALLASLAPPALSGPAGPLPRSAPVALHPYATHALKSWPTAHWLDLAARLEERGLAWLVLGRGAPLFPGAANDFTNRTSLRETLGLLSLCRVLVTGDSGPMHMATAVGTPVLALFGPTTREWGFFPQGRHDRVLEKDLPCRPCSLHGKKPCPRSGQCLTTIAPQEVLENIALFPPRSLALSAS